MEGKPVLNIKIIDTTMPRDVLIEVMKITNESKKISKVNAELAEIIKNRL